MRVWKGGVRKEPTCRCQVQVCADRAEFLLQMRATPQLTRLSGFQGRTSASAVIIGQTTRTHAKTNPLTLTDCLSFSLYIHTYIHIFRLYLSYRYTHVSPFSCFTLSLSHASLSLSLSLSLYVYRDSISHTHTHTLIHTTHIPPAGRE